jgi:hypothetical protein
VKFLLRVALLGIAALVVLLGVLLVGARFADGPIAIIAGGPFTTGERVTGPEPDWSFARDVREVEFQLVAPPRSRTTWILEHEGRIFIPCGYMTTRWGRLWKKWPLEALSDGRAILRIDGKLYERTLVRIESGPLLAPLTAELSRKYAGGAAIGPEAVTSGSLWLFELAPRS